MDWQVVGHLDPTPITSASLQEDMIELGYMPYVRFCSGISSEECNRLHWHQLTGYHANYRPEYCVRCNILLKQRKVASKIKLLSKSLKWEPFMIEAVAPLLQGDYTWKDISLGNAGSMMQILLQEIHSAQPKPEDAQIERDRLMNKIMECLITVDGNRRHVFYTFPRTIGNSG